LKKRRKNVILLEQPVALSTRGGQGIYRPPSRPSSRSLH
jgi:hypothetical protein